MPISRVHKLEAVLAISIAFFLVEISIGFKTGALALIADAFHYFNRRRIDSDQAESAYCWCILVLTTQPPGYTFAYRRAEILGAFFNASFLLALALSILLQSIDRFISVPEIDHPLWVLIVGCCGLALNVLSILLVHEHGSHDHGTSQQMEALDLELSRIQAPGSAVSVGGLVDHSDHHHAQRADEPKSTPRNLGLLGVLAHLFGDAINNIGVIVAAAIMWKVPSPHRFYADPAISMVISLIIFGGAIPLARRSARVLLEAAPRDMNPELIREDLLTIPGVISIHELHLWHLTETDALASFHVKVDVKDIKSWLPIEKELRSCFAAHGVTHVTIAPEFQSISGSPGGATTQGEAPGRRGPTWECDAECGVGNI